jgi:hypothetical protein
VDDFGRTAPTSLRDEHLAVHEQLTAPDSPWFLPLERSLKAFGENGAFGTNPFRSGDLTDVLAEKECSCLRYGTTGSNVLPEDVFERACEFEVGVDEGLHDLVFFSFLVG